MSDIVNFGMGWLPDYPDCRDYTKAQNDISQELKVLGQTDPINIMLSKVNNPATLPGSSDLSAYFSPVENQFSIGSCTAQAAVSLVEYFERRSFGRHIDASRIFLYKVSRNLMHKTGDTGSYLRTVMKALVLFGVPPEEYWPYDINKFDIEPPAFCYAFAQNYKAISYYRLDQNCAVNDLLIQIKTNLAANLPIMFGFSVYRSIWDDNVKKTGDIPYPTSEDRLVGGHAVAAVGYDDNKMIGTYQGALKIRNSWGASWGNDGYGWLPYEYVLQGLAVDWWSLLKNEWINTGNF